MSLLEDKTSNLSLSEPFRGHMMQVEDDELIFTGKDGEECERFIRAVRRKAFAAGKLRDNAWTMDLVSVCLAGEALRWHYTLPPADRDDWVRLQDLLLQQYPRQPSNIIPAAPSAFASWSAPSRSLPSRLQTQNGRIKIMRQGDHAGFVSRAADQKGLLHFTTKELDALNIQFDYSGPPHEIKVTNTPHNATYLGAASTIGVDGAEIRTKLLFFDRDGTSVFPTTRVDAPQKAIWNVSPVDSIVRMWWSQDGMGYLLKLVIRFDKNRMAFVHNRRAFVKEAKADGVVWAKAHLEFEPL